MISLQLEAKRSDIQRELAKTKQDLDNLQSERTRITCEFLRFSPLRRVLTHATCSQLESEANEKLLEVYQKLMQIGVDRNESEKETKLKETLASLQRLFPGEHLHESFLSLFY